MLGVLRDPSTYYSDEAGNWSLSHLSMSGKWNTCTSTSRGQCFIGTVVSDFASAGKGLLELQPHQLLRLIIERDSPRFSRPE